MSVTLVAASERTGRWQEHPGLGVYVHIPFCAHRCHYCDFNTYEGLSELHRPYVDALVRHIDSRPDRRLVTSIFFGGGTPTLLPPRELGRVLTAIRARYEVAQDAEVTAEVNPETVDAGAFAALLEAGFNRFSIGVQSLAPHVLRALGRTHNAATALRALEAARAAGADDVNLDLIYGSPWERDEDWVTTLRGVVAAEPDHVSAYALTIEEGTPLATLVTTGRAPDVDPDVQARRHETASAVLASAGYERYEISNWARPGRASRHNVLYWSAGDYLAFGAGAHGHDGGRRWWNVRLPRDLIDAPSSADAAAGEEILAGDQRAGEALMLGLRLASGVPRAAFERRFPGALEERRAVIEDLTGHGLLAMGDGRIELTERGTMVANDIVCRLL